ncbi:EF0163 family protein [Lactococcus petauri]|uniref:EF0163 family protein n=1 Tax=Lactococcus petauri TaxID=1940789 RepID=UPI0018AADA19|nr:EF0163 family protein [Lactococcus petauri]MDC0826936.1 hypothetical protein [Lactococcus petauri]
MKKLSILIIGLSSVFLLSACGKSQVSKPSKIEVASSVEQVQTSSSKVENSKANETPQSKENKFDSAKAKSAVEGFIQSYYNYTSENKRNEATQSLCTSEVQKKLHLVKSDKEIKMESRLTDFEIYQGSNDDYLVLVSYTINDNQVVPQVLKISVETSGDSYKISEVLFPLMN